MERLGANVLENSLFSKSVLEKMLLFERLKVGLYFVLWVAVLASQQVNPDVIIVISQSVFSAEVIARWISMETLRVRYVKVYDDLYNIFLTKSYLATNANALFIDSLLQELVDRTDVTLSVTASTISDAVQELQGLEKEESEISRELTTLRRRLEEMTRIRKSAANYHEGLHIQRDRLQVSSWLVAQRTGDEGCPVCGGHMEPSADKLDQLNHALVAFEQESGDNFEIPAAFEREMQRVSADVNEGAEKLKAVQIRKRALTQRSKAAENQQYQTKMVERFIGRLENAFKLRGQYI